MTFRNEGETWDYLNTKSRDQDLFYYFIGLQQNHKTRHFLVENFRKDYEKVNIWCMLAANTC